MNNPSIGKQHTYRRKGWFLTGFFGVVLLCLSILLLIQNPQLPHLGLIAFLFALILFSSALLIRLTVSGRGIFYYQVGYGIFAKWDQIESIDECKAGRVRTDCITLKDYELKGFKSLTKFSGLRPHRYSIPVGLFDRNWREGNLGRDIKQYAPQLLQVNG
jgi:hypothetical protein